MSQPRILIAGIGNILRGDDGFGVRVVQRLANGFSHDNVKVIDFGIRGLDLALELLENYDAVILIDAMSRGGSPGTLYLIEPQIEVGTLAEFETHDMVPEKLLQWAAAMGADLPSVRIVGCEPEFLGRDDELVDQLSESVLAAIEPAVEIVRSEIRVRLPSGRGKEKPHADEATNSVSGLSQLRCTN